MKPTSILMQEHRAIERMLNVIDRLVDRAEAGESVPAANFRDALRFIQNFADRCHHGKEEGLLFPAMERVGFQRQSGPIAVMLYEHDEGRALVRAMAEAIERYATGDSGALAPLARHARQFCGLLRAHIQKEDNVLFMMADMHIPPEEQSKLEQEFTKLESSGEACMLKVELLSLLERMEQDVWQPA